ncbi:MAG TPA: NAD(+) synthase, partial [Clostridiales bacterium]|nr:NAD(+) synthase [Clostridiales bacterium]
GATVIGNLSASDEVIAKAAYRRLLVQSHSARLICAYLYADAGEGESSTDLVFAGHDLIYENGRCLAESNLFSTGLTTADIDVQLLVQERRRQNTFVGSDPESHRRIDFSLIPAELPLRRLVPSTPFVPADRQDLAARCEEILALQVNGLKKRLAHIACQSAVIGLSGGLDSTLALLVTARAFDSLGLARSGILAVTMPGFGTSDRTWQNACALAGKLGATLREIPIGQAVLGHFADIGHDPACQDTTYENAQARERTQILMDLANQMNGLVIGTGDLSELALGWATYNGDHMSMYGVNCSVPKTLVRHLVNYAASQSEPELRQVLLDVLDTPVSPELLPLMQGEIVQKTEHIVGPYELHDFFLYYLVRYGFTPAKIRRLARLAFAGQYEPAVIDRWLKTFLRRFFAQQFKRSCLPDGPKVGSVTLSPRGDWRMPSDAVAALWLDSV